MEGIGSEVSHKIRAAIKAKLIELGAYVDDELPDYIMVMVANKRTRTQMDEDLQLFLSSNTKIFTSWLHTVLQKLQEVTVANFEGKKDSDSKKSSKRKKSETEDGRSRKSSEDGTEKIKKHSKKHKETKKSKKNKHKSKEKTKGKKSEKDGSKEKSEKEEQEQEEEEVKKASQEKTSKNKRLELNEAVGRAILGDLKKSKKLKGDSPSGSSSSSEDESKMDGRGAKENENVSGSNKPETQAAGEEVLNVDETDKADRADVYSNKQNTTEVIEDEFNIEPLKPAEKDEGNTEPGEDGEPKGGGKSKEAENAEVEKTISAPTEELLKEHDKIQNEQFEGEGKQGEEKRRPKSDSEESLSPEEIRKQLLLSRAKKKLEESKKAERMRSNSPDVLIVEDACELGGRQKDLLSASSRQPEARSVASSRSCGGGSSRTGSPRPGRQLYSDRRSPSTDRSPYRRGASVKAPEGKSSNAEKRKISFSKSGRNSPPAEKDEKTFGVEKKKNVIRISESLEMEKNMRVKKDTETKSREREFSRKRPVSSRVVTITGPEAPEIPSIVKVKPREFISKDKQANKALILKAVADAEKSIATVHARPEIEPEPKKEALYTKNLREKRYEKLAITLSNIRRNVNSRGRRTSVESEKSDKKRDSSDVSDGVRIKSDLLSRKISKSEDQFISSKTTIMEKNDKYIRCWLEGVEKAVKDDEMINPSEMEDFVPANFSDEENDSLEKDDEKKRKRKSTETSADVSSKSLKLSEKEIASLRVLPNAGLKDDEPQIVVTLDGLDSKAIKNLIMKNKETAGRPLLSGTTRKPDKSPAPPAREKPDLAETRKSGYEKISDRFGRLNRANNEEESGKSEKKSSKRETPETEKKEKAAKTESKNRQLIAQLSEKFGKVDREFESRKRKRPEEDRRYSYEARRNDKEDNERNGRYRKSERRSFREGVDPEEITRTISRDRCLYWPYCSKGTTCEYFHPTSPCKSFPNCKFKDECTFVHPRCRNGKRCRDSNYSYEHSSPAGRAGRSSPVTKPRQSRQHSFRFSPPRKSSYSQTCKFYPNCTNLECRFFHPKRCRFDENCTKSNCKYVHPETFPGTKAKRRPKA